MLASDGEVSYTMLIYETIEWGQQSNFTAGLNAGDGERFEVLIGPMESLLNNSNVDKPGVYIYRTDLPNILERNGKY